MMLNNNKIIINARCFVIWGLFALFATLPSVAVAVADAHTTFNVRGPGASAPDYTTIQDAVNAVADGVPTLIIIAAGVYTTADQVAPSTTAFINIPTNKLITLECASATEDATGCIIQGRNDARAPLMKVSRGSTVIVEHLTFQDNRNTRTFGGGIDNQGDLTLFKCAVTRNNALNGGGISNSGHYAKLTVDGSSIDTNTVSNLGGGIHNNGGEVTVDGSGITTNTSDYGGGIFNVGAVIIRGGSSITTNTAVYYGGGILQ
jgi:hypothetical protein